MLGGRRGVGVMTSGGCGGVCKWAKRRVQGAIGAEGKAGRLTLEARRDDSRRAGSKAGAGGNAGSRNGRLVQLSIMYVVCM